MSMVKYCIDHVIDGPNEISDYALKLAFTNPISGFGFPSFNVDGSDADYSVEQGIREKVIYKMIGRMINASGGVTEVIDLTNARIRYLGNGSISVNVPDTLTGGRDIISVRGVFPGTIATMTQYDGARMSSRCGTGGAMGAAMNRIVRGLTNDSVVSMFTDITTTGRNSFLIRNAGTIIYALSAKVVLSYDEEFSVIPPGAYEYLGKLTVLGTKVYIYKHCRRGLKEAVKRFGFSVDDLQDEIDGYSDAHIQYEELYNKIKKILKYADAKGVSDHISMTIPRRL